MRLSYLAQHFTAIREAVVGEIQLNKVQAELLLHFLHLVQHLQPLPFSADLLLLFFFSLFCCLNKNDKKLRRNHMLYVYLTFLLLLQEKRVVEGFNACSTDGIVFQDQRGQALVGSQCFTKIGQLRVVYRTNMTKI